MKTLQVSAGVAALLIAALLFAAITDRVWNAKHGVYERRPPTYMPMPEIDDWNSLRIKLTRTWCEGSCPDYSVEITGDGRLTYVGNGYVAVLGTRHATIPVDRVRALHEKFRDAEFFWLFDEYRDASIDNPTHTISIAYDGVTKTVTDYVGLRVGMPITVIELEYAIDETADIARWTRGQPVKD